MTRCSIFVLGVWLTLAIAISIPTFARQGFALAHQASVSGAVTADASTRQAFTWQHTAQAVRGSGSGGSPARPGASMEHRGIPKGWKFSWPRGGNPANGGEIFAELECFGRLHPDRNLRGATRSAVSVSRPPRTRAGRVPSCR